MIQLSKSKTIKGVYIIRHGFLIWTLWNYQRTSLGLGLEVTNRRRLTNLIVQHHCHYDLRKFYFTNRVIPVLNSLSNRVVSAETANTVNKNS